MATVTGVTAARAKAIEDASVVSGHISGTHLYLTTKGGDETDAGKVVPDPPYFYSEQTPLPVDATLTTSNQTFFAFSLSAAAPSEDTAYTVTLSLDVTTTFKVTNNASAVFELLVDGVAQPYPMTLMLPAMKNINDVVRLPLTRTWRVTDKLGSFSVSVRARLLEASDVDVVVNAAGSTMHMTGQLATATPVV